VSACSAAPRPRAAWLAGRERHTWMTQVDLPSLQLQSCCQLGLRVTGSHFTPVILTLTVDLMTFIPRRFAGGRQLLTRQTFMAQNNHLIGFSKLMIFYKDSCLVLRNAWVSLWQRHFSVQFDLLLSVVNGQQQDCSGLYSPSSSSLLKVEGQGQRLQLHFCLSCVL